MINSDTVDQKDVVFTPPLQMFKNNSYNDTMSEYRIEDVIANPANPDSEVYTFTRPANNVGLMKTSDAVLCANVHITKGDNALEHAEAGTAPIPLFLRTYWRSKEVKVDDILVSSESNHGHIISHVKFLTRTKPTQIKDAPKLNLAIFDTSPGADGANVMDSVADFHDAGGNLVNQAARERIVMFKRVVEGAFLMDSVDTVLFNEGGTDVYLPSVFKLELRLTRIATNLALQGADCATVGNGRIDNVKIRLHDFKLKIPIYKPKDQLSQAINALLVHQNAECKYYTTNYRVVAIPIPAGRRSHDCVNVFNGTVPTRCFLMYLNQNNFNGSYDSNCFNYIWPNYSEIEFTVNSVTYQKLTHYKEMYHELRKTLNRRTEEMPMSLDQYNAGSCVVGVDLTSNQDSHLKVLPLRPAGVVNCNLKFSAGTTAGFLTFVGEFRNELKIGLKTPARLMHDF